MSSECADEKGVGSTEAGRAAAGAGGDGATAAGVAGGGAVAHEAASSAPTRAKSAGRFTLSVILAAKEAPTV